MKAIPTERCVNWLSFVELVEKTAPLPAPGKPGDVWLFRGENDTASGLVPSIEKYPFLRPIRETEKLLLYDFQTSAPLVAQDVPPENDLAGWLSLMRHHGVPTRLLDWSYSPFVAAYFALGRNPGGMIPKEAISVVWALNMTAVESRAMFIAKKLGWTKLPAGRLDFSEQSFLEAYALTPRFEQQRNAKTGLVVPILPRSRSQRLASQQGIFLLNCNYAMSFWDSLTSMMGPLREPWIRKIEIPRVERISILRRLFQQNTHPFTLFSDLDSLGKSLLLKRELYPEGSLRLPGSWESLP